MLGPIDPQLGQLPAASLIKVLEEKPIAEIDDQTLIMADVGRKAIQQVEAAAAELLRRHMEAKAACELAAKLATGTWTHDYPISAEEARLLGLPVSTDMPDEILQLMALYPQPMQRQGGGVEYHIEFSIRVYSKYLLVHLRRKFETLINPPDGRWVSRTWSLDKPVYSRPKKSYNRPFLEKYVPNGTVYVPVELRREMAQKGQRVSTGLAAGTFARQIYQRLLIDLSFNSSRLEGNTYSELDTKRLVEEGISAEGKVREETVMIMNHKQAISFLVENAQDIELSAFTIYNLHALLSEDLLKNPMACGNVRSVSVEIGKSAYKPMDNPHQLKEYLEMLLLKARSIEDPFEQSFFLLIHLSYLQAFEDVNKRTARLACNIPFFKSNLCPLSFVKLPRDDYLNALLMIYEANTLEPMLELYHWAYLRSCEHMMLLRKVLVKLTLSVLNIASSAKTLWGR